MRAGALSISARGMARLVSVPIAGLAAVAAASCGSDSTGVGLPDKPMASVAVAVGQQFSCALSSDGASYCWGDNVKGQLGDSTFINKLVPTPTAGGHRFVAIAAASATVCALDHGGAVWCWGEDPTQPGIPVAYSTVPVAVPSPRPFKSITVGRKFACGLDTGGAAYCWGENGRGQLGAGDTTGRAVATPVKTSDRYSTISAEFFSACALTASGAAACWGDNQFGELGTGDMVTASSPRAVGGSLTFHQLSSGPIHQCGLASDGRAYCWGNNSSGQLGDGTVETRLLPAAVAGGLTFSMIRSSRVNSIFTTTCGVASAGLYCWGYDSKGQLGTASATSACVPFTPPGVVNNNTTPTFVCAYLPVKITGVSNVVALDVGFEHVCALVSPPQVLCWGDGLHGELGDGNAAASKTPVLIKGGPALP